MIFRFGVVVLRMSSLLSISIYGTLSILVRNNISVASKFNVVSHLLFAGNVQNHFHGTSLFINWLDELPLLVAMATAGHLGLPIMCIT